MKNIKLIHFSIEFFNLLYFRTRLEVKKNTKIILITPKRILINIYIFMNVKSKFLFS
jgi:hypothetical protein